MALPVFMLAKLDGTEVAPEMEFDNTIQSMGGNDVANHFQVLSWEAEVSVGTAGTSNLGSQAQTGRRHSPWKIRFLVGKGFPLFFKGLRTNQEVELEMKLFIEHPQTGRTEALHTARITRGRIVSLKIVSPDTLHPETTNLPVYAEMEVVGHSIEHESARGTTDLDNYLERG